MKEPLVASLARVGLLLSREAKFRLEIPPVRIAIWITVTVRPLADFERNDGVNLPKRKAFWLPRYWVGCIAIRDVQIVVKEAAFNQKQFSA